MSEAMLIGIDEGTTAVKVGSFDLGLAPLAQARREISTSHPAPGLVEQDPEEILEAVVDAVAEVLAATPERTVLAAGLAHQGESVLAWEGESGRALSPVITWRDKRQEQLLARLDPGAVTRSGLPLDPYFSAGKLAWLLENDPYVSMAGEVGTLRLGTVDAFLSDRLGGRFATDLSTASRTQLLALGGRAWDTQLMVLFGMRSEWLPEIAPTFGELGELRSPRWPVALPLRARLVDQQAALAGSGTIAAGEVKATYGTGVFVLGRTAEPVRAPGLLPTIAWAANAPGGTIGEVDYALDGGVFAAGSMLDWLSRGGLRLAPDTAALMRLAAGVDDSAGVRVLPALDGLGAPWWQPGAHGVIAGLHAGVGPAHIARAALESIAWRVADIVEAMRAVSPVETVRVDGGLTRDETLLRIQADALGLPLTLGEADTTVRGAAMLAGVGARAFADLGAAAGLLEPGRTITPGLDEVERVRRQAAWRTFVERSAALG
ncbi:MAG TPA: FGGY family carbohydrate kinase [Solirubrobacteraceae bacterium]